MFITVWHLRHEIKPVCCQGSYSVRYPSKYMYTLNLLLKTWLVIRCTAVYTKCFYFLTLLRLCSLTVYINAVHSHQNVYLPLHSLHRIQLVYSWKNIFVSWTSLIRNWSRNDSMTRTRKSWWPVNVNNNRICFPLRSFCILFILRIDLTDLDIQIRDLLLQNLLHQVHSTES